MPVLYSIPVKVASTGTAIRCTIPREIAAKLKVEPGDELIWILHENGRVEIKVQEKEVAD